VLLIPTGRAVLARTLLFISVIFYMTISCNPNYL